MSGWQAGMIGLALAGCGLFGPSVERYIIRVDQIIVPRVTTAGDTLWVRFQGAIGPSGCYWLARVDRKVSRTSLDVTFRGEHEDALCTQAPVALDYTIPVPPPLQDPFTITVHQPDLSVMTRVVAVEP
jgi:hypothetical protein